MYTVCRKLFKSRNPLSVDIFSVKLSESVLLGECQQVFSKPIKSQKSSGFSSKTFRKIFRKKFVLSSTNRRLSVGQ